MNNSDNTSNSLIGNDKQGFTKFLTDDFSIPDSFSDLQDVWHNFALILLELAPNEFCAGFNKKELAQFFWDRFEFFISKKNKSHHIKISDISEQINRQMLKKGTHLPVNLDHFSLIEIAADDRPFIIDNFYNLLGIHQLKVNMLIHPIFSLIKVRGRCKVIDLANAESKIRLSYVCCIVRHHSDFSSQVFSLEIDQTLNLLKVVVDDFPSIKVACEKHTIVHQDGVGESISDAEQRAIFRWYLGGNIIFFGYGSILENKITKNINWQDIKNPLGWLKLIIKDNDHATQRMVLEALLYFSKSHLRNSLMEINFKPLLRDRSRLILALHKIYDENYNTVVVVLPCVFSNKSHHEYILNIPIVRLKLAGVFEKIGLLLDSHDYKNIIELYGHIPRQELFRMDREELIYLYKRAQDLWEVNQLMMHVYTKPGIDYIRITVILPLEKMSTVAVDTIKKEFKKYWGKDANYFYFFVYKQLAHIHFAWLIDWKKIELLDIDSLSQILRNKLKSWQESLKELSLALPSTQKSISIADIINSDLPENYRSVVSPQDALRDIIEIDKLLADGQDRIIIRRKGDTKSKITIYSFTNYSLRKTFLKFDSLGLEPTNSDQILLKIAGKNVYVQMFLSSHPHISVADFSDLSKRFIDFFKASLKEEIRNDAIFSLLFSTRLTTKQIEILKAYRNYLSLTNVAFSQVNLTKVLLDYPNFSENLVDYFEQKFIPVQKIKGDRNKYLTKKITYLNEEIAKSETVLEDIALKSLVAIASTTIRTNYYLKNYQALAIKIDCSANEYIPTPKPLYEIFVINDILEGVHLRGGKISRGGIRHSDRLDDYRSEVLDLMQTQMLKNVLIVPVGSKGGFIVNKSWPSRKEQLAELPNYYKDYIKSLLSLTDTIKNGKAVHPEGLITYDGYDPYLVVAADKGTASYSDFANQISLEANYWLGDAFASGGSNGYNHKSLGITARGAFECLKIHFQELGFDFKKDIFRMVAIGDMSGDVFGNGMLLSENIKLVGAFNHLYIFIDPTPNPKTSFTERKRLFNLANSSWKDYNQSLISKGGGIFSRNSKSITLTPEMKNLLRSTQKSLSGIEMIREILLLDVEVIFNGGIGVYIKSSNETNGQAGDKSNDNVRVDASDLNAKIILEGGNLGVTPLGRIEFNLAGGLINNDAIDNSAGVDMSDREVNIKILLNELANQGKIKTATKRQEIFNALSDSVTKLCLINNQLQSYRISLDQRRSKIEGNYYISEIEHLETVANLSRKDNDIPKFQWFINLLKQNLAIPRPLLAILLAHMKNYVYNIIFQSDLADSAYMDHYFQEYFPTALQKEFDLKNTSHPLRREIICATLTNFFINRNGMIFLANVHVITSNKVIDIIKSFFIVNTFFPHAEKGLMDSLLKECRPGGFDKACRLVMDVENIVKERTVWLLANFAPRKLNLDSLSSFKNSLDEFLKQPASVKYHPNTAKLNKKKQQLIDLGYSKKIVDAYMSQVSLNNPFESVFLHKVSNLSFKEIQVIIHQMEDYFNFAVIENMLFETISTDEWEKAFVGGLILKTNLIKRGYYRIVGLYINKVGPQNAFDQFISDIEPMLHKYRKAWLKFYANQDNHLKAISVLLDKLNRYLKISKKSASVEEIK
ncbi:MAG: NAD-glutamate dehydrogenase [SAR324 cluster bacterium]|nr:NAD-glutamate dehydrogenase [SAR324 cluster bacterium]